MLFLHRGRSSKVLRILWLSNRQYTKKSLKGISPTTKALQHFDDYYGSVFGKDWNSIRLAMLCKPKTIALINGFSTYENEMEEILISSGAENIASLIDSTQNQKLYKSSRRKSYVHEGTPTTEDNFECSPENRFSLESYVPVSKMRFQEEIITETEYYSFYSSENVSIEFITENELVFPTHWKVMSFPRGNIGNFPTTVKDDIGLFPVKIMNGSSILPVVALNVQPSDEVADLCAGVGDQSLAILLSMNPKSILLNDVSSSKLSVLRKTLNDFVPDFFMKHVELDIQQRDVRTLETEKKFDKIILDVPCTQDRQSVVTEDNNFFSGSLVKKRNQLPYYLRDMLVSALGMLKVDGSLVYCTSTLSPVLNDGIVQEALYSFTSDKPSTFAVNDMKECFKPFSTCFRLDFSFRYGILVLPYLLNNYGPTYMSKITRVS